MSRDLGPHQTLHGSARRIRRFYYRCKCGGLRGRNAQSTCPVCDHPPASWSPEAVRSYLKFVRERAARLAKQGYAIVDGAITYVGHP